MSSSFYNSYTQFAVNSAICFGMQDLQALANYVHSEMRMQNLSLHDVSKRSGGLISHATVNNVLNQASKEVKAKTIAGLARGLGKPESEVRAVVYGERTERTLESFVQELQALGVEEFSAAKGTKKLTPRDMDEILAVMRSTAKAMIEQKLKSKDR